MIKRFAKYYSPYIKIFSADLFAAMLLSACDLFYPNITENMIDRLIPDGKYKEVLIWGAVLVLLYILKLFLNYFIAYYGHNMGVYMQADMRRDMFAKLEKLPCNYFDRNKTGSLMSRMTNDLFDISELAHHGPEDLFISFILFVGSCIFMARINVPLTVICFAPVPFMIWFAARARMKMQDAFRESRVEIGEINAGLENSISGIRVSKAYTSESAEAKKFSGLNLRFVGARRKAYKAMGQFHSGMSFGTDILRLIVLVAGGMYAIFGSLTPGELVAFMLYVNVFIQPINKLIGFVEQYQNGMTGFARFCEVMDAEEEKDSPDAEDITEIKGKIEFTNVTFAYNDNDGPVLKNLSFTVPAGKKLALVGASGGGKTSICHLIPRFYEIQDGEITLDGKDIRSYTRLSLRKHIGIVSQDVFLFNDTIYANILYGRADATRDEVYEAAKKARIHEYILSLPEGYETVVGERGARLSGGQKQRISIARVFLKNPAILILDEATSALDNVTEREIQQSLSELSAGRTSIVVAHRLSTVKDADEIILLDKRGIRERGSHEELVRAGGEYARLVSATVTTISGN